MLQAGMHQVFDEAKDSNYLVFIICRNVGLAKIKRMGKRTVLMRFALLEYLINRN